ncbi:MAG: hypothetical protein ACUVTU_07555 [Desulfurispora sp.]|uniref:hypothetical protein n=1 Tax=Desulfurispora sp. TaxID=3014275 RepID=UPI0040492EDD
MQKAWQKSENFIKNIFSLLKYPFLGLPAGGTGLAFLGRAVLNVNHSNHAVGKNKKKQANQPACF